MAIERAPMWRQTWRDKRVATFACLGLLADLDFLFGLHSAYSHSVGATVVVGGIAAVLGRNRGARFALAAAVAYGTHVLLDWLGSDTVEPLGVMALWPVSTDYFLSDRFWFASVCRRYAELGCWAHDMRGLVKECVLLGPFAIGAVYYLHRHDAQI